MHFFKKKTLLFIIIFLIVLQPIVINAQDNFSLKNELINPGSFYYSFKRLWEKSLDKLQFSRQSKINFYNSQLQVRLAELNYVVENNLLGELQQSSERFAYTAGILTEELEKQKVIEKEKFINDFKKYQGFLERLRDKYPANTSFWMLVQHDINSLNILSDRLLK